MMSKTLKLLEKLVEFDSSKQETANETIEFCQQWLKDEGVDSEILINNDYKMLVSTIGSGDQRLILNGHVDVVSGNSEQFTPQIKDGRIYGRGTADMKAGVASLMVAMTDLQHLDLGNVSVQLQLVTDEETGGQHCAGYLTEKGYLGDFVICAEPTQVDIGLQAKGVLQFNLQIEGKSAHGSRPWEGENAIVKAMKVYEKILTLPFASESTDIYEYPSINLAKIEGGDVYNKVPGKCTLSFDIRYLPTQDPDKILKQIEEVTDGEIEVHSCGAAVTNDKDNPFIQTLIKQVQSVTGDDEVRVFGQHGLADTRYFAEYDMPAIEFGPAGGEWHGDGEYAEIDSLDTYKDIIVKFAQNFSN